MAATLTSALGSSKPNPAPLSCAIFNIGDARASSNPPAALAWVWAAFKKHVVLVKDLGTVQPTNGSKSFSKWNPHEEVVTASRFREEN